MKKSFISISTIIVITLSTAFCKSPYQISETPLYDKKWYLVKIHHATGSEEITTKKAFIQFDKEKKSAGGNGSCNLFGSNLAVSGDLISITEIFSTKMYCEGVQKTEDAFLMQLEKATRYKTSEKKLLLYRDNELLLEFDTGSE